MNRSGDLTGMPPRRPEERFLTLRGWEPVSDVAKLTRRGEQHSDFVPAGPAFPPEISVIILTLNEEVNLPRALASVSGSNDVVVLDCGSSDRTTDIAEAYGARVFEHAFETSAAQRQWALDNIQYRNAWLWVLDADEWVTKGLAGELSAFIRSPGADEVVAAWARGRVVIDGRWCPRATMYPTWTMRLLRLGRVSYENRAINAHGEAEGRNIRLTSDFIHEDLRSASTRFLKLEKSARLEAIESLTSRRGLVSGIRSATSTRRRAKLLFSALPCRALLMAVALVARGALFEGRAGLRMMEERIIQERLTSRYIRELKLEERRSTG